MPPPLQEVISKLGGKELHRKIILVCFIDLIQRQGWGTQAQSSLPWAFSRSPMAEG